MSQATDDPEEVVARAQFEYHRRRHDELCADMLRARSEAAAHHQIMEGLALLHPALREEYATSFIRETDVGSDESEPPAHTFEEGARRLSERVESDAHPPQGIEALRRVLAGHPGEFHTVGEIFHLLKAVGAAPSHARVVRNTLNRAMDAGLVEKRTDSLGYVKYAWKSRVRRVADLDDAMREIAESVGGQIESAVRGGRFAEGASG